MEQPLILRSFPRAIIHIDGDAFFASCEQALDPRLQGKPVITGKERGIAASMSYEAKARGITRAMRASEIFKLCPDAIWLPSDYETYSLLSKRFYDIVRRYTSDVEEYGIDECFADITGMQRPFHKSYRKIAEQLQDDLKQELGFTFSAGLAPNKVIAKIASKWKKPSGLTVIPGRDIHQFLSLVPIDKVWGIGPATTALLHQYRAYTALQFARKDAAWVQERFSKPFYEIWQELNGRFIYPLILDEKQSYYSIQKVKTFTPPSSDRTFVFSQLSKNIENACIKARRYHQAAREVIFFLRRQDFTHAGIALKLSRPSSLPSEIIGVLENVFNDIFDQRLSYRMTGVVLAKLTEDVIVQPDLFGSALHAEKLLRVYKALDELSARYGKHTVFLGSSFQAQRFAQHLGDRGDVPRRKKLLFKHETKRRRIGIPLFQGKVS